jgi:parallel beta-helix repeat protein
MIWTPGDVSGLQTLTDDDHLYPGHINELRIAINGKGYLVVADDGTGDYNCDGTADDLQINAAISSLTSGGIILLKGSFSIADTINITNPNITLLGRGIGLDTVTCVGDIVGMEITGHFTTLKDFTFDADTNVYNAIHTTSANYFTAKRMEVKNAGLNGIQCSYGYYHKILDCYLHDNANANSINMCAGINFDQVSNFTVKDNYLYNNANVANRGAAIYAGVSYYGNIGNNQAYLNDYGLDIARCYQITAIGNHCYQNDDIGIDFSNGGQQNIIHGNYCYLNGNDGIRVWASDGTTNSQYFTLIGNICDSNGRRDAGSAGIRISTAATGISVAQRMTITGNTCMERLGGTPRQDYGILSEQRSDYLNVTGNWCYNNNTDQVSLVGSNNINANNGIT